MCPLSSLLIVVWTTLSALMERAPPGACLLYQGIWNARRRPISAPIRPGLQNLGSANGGKSGRAKFETFDAEEGLKSIKFFTRMITICINHDL
ncbi:hypothetical protein TNCV_947741 [Trichonephila clavipes]|nr:hypothetical protein TNCV_947741 [Trichonephila clavipes]